MVSRVVGIASILNRAATLHLRLGACRDLVHDAYAPGPAVLSISECTAEGLSVHDQQVQRVVESSHSDTLRETERRLNAVLDNATVAIFLMDENQQCAYMNRAAEKLTGYTIEETKGRPLHDVIHHTRPDGTPFPVEECPIDRAFPEHNQMQGEEVFVHKDGSFYPVAYTASPIQDEGGERRWHHH